MQKSIPYQQYRKLIEKHSLALDLLIKKRKRLGWIRLFVFIVTIIITYKVFVSAGLIGLVPLITGIAILLFLVSIDVNNNQEIANKKTLVRINQEELRILDHDYYDRFSGKDYSPEIHDYANDLDLFGKASFFQWANRCHSEQGRELLAVNLLSPLPVKAILDRQEAVKELSPLVEWRQQLQALAMQTPISLQTQRKAEFWLNEEDKHFRNPVWKAVVQVYSILTLGSAIAAIGGYIPGTIFSFLFIVYLTTSMILSRNTIAPYVHLSGIVKEIHILQQLVAWIEEQKFHSALMKQIQEECGRQKASDQIKDLKTILDRFDLRLNIFGLLFFNSFLLWDVRQMIALNEWRKKNRDHVSKWFHMIAETEVLNSLAAIQFNEPDWCLPEFTSEHFSFQADRLGHPLIREKLRITSDFEMKGTAQLALVTGSNMAGKSTFLRSLGINIVMAQMGAPVCAKKLILSPVHLMSSMRIADNLAENTSTFYAELKKLKTIIEAVNRHEQVFILLDEILRGTNSFDRHTGSEALMAQLVREKAVAVIATHDIALARLEEQFPGSVKNYHFDVQVEGEELYFDYKLKQGVCTSMNASILMKKIGIDLTAKS